VSSSHSPGFSAELESLDEFACRKKREKRGRNLPLTSFSEPLRLALEQLALRTCRTAERIPWLAGTGLIYSKLHTDVL
jgi:hypothetical protein